MRQNLNTCVRSLVFAIACLISVIFHSNVNAQQIHVSESELAVGFVVPETFLTETFLVTMSAEWSNGQFGLFLLLGDPILDKAGNTPPTGDDVPAGPTYDPTVGPYKPPKYWEPIDYKTIPIF